MFRNKIMNHHHPSKKELKKQEESLNNKPNPMDYEEHDDIVADMLESPQWANGNAGILRAGKPLFATLTRSEDTFWVSPIYTINEQQAFDIFYAFLALRSLYYEQHPELGRPLNAGLDASRNSVSEGNIGFTSVFAAAAVARAIKKFKQKADRAMMKRGCRPEGDEKAIISIDDVRRVATFICEADATEVMSERFMKEFDPEKTGSVSLRAFLGYLESECSKRKLTRLEQFFFLFDEPLSSKMSFFVAMFVMTLIVISSIGFILSTEPMFQVSAKHATEGTFGSSVNDDDDLSQPPEAMPIFFDIETVCILIFTLEYLCRVCTVWAVRESLRSPKIKIPILDSRMPILTLEEERKFAMENFLKSGSHGSDDYNNDKNVHDYAALLQKEIHEKYDFQKTGGVAASSSSHHRMFGGSGNNSRPSSCGNSADGGGGGHSRNDSFDGSARPERRNRESVSAPRHKWKGNSSFAATRALPDIPLDSDVGGGGAGGHKNNDLKDSGLRRTYNYVTSPMNIIDLIAIAPFYIGLFMDGGSGLAVLRILRLARVFRIFKVGKYNEGITMLSNTLKKSLPALQLMGFFSTIAVILFGSLIYFAESGVWHRPYSCVDVDDFDCDHGGFLRPTVTGRGKEPTPFSSIPRCFWFIVVTSTTVGYGDMVPTTPYGKIIATCTMCAAILVLALPITIIGTNFSEEYDRVQERKSREIREREKERRRTEETKNAAIDNEPQFSDDDSSLSENENDSEIKATMATFFNTLPSNGTFGEATFKGNVDWVNENAVVLSEAKLKKIKRKKRGGGIEGLLDDDEDENGDDDKDLTEDDSKAHDANSIDFVPPNKNRNPTLTLSSTTTTTASTEMTLLNHGGGGSGGSAVLEPLDEGDDASEEDSIEEEELDAASVSSKTKKKTVVIAKPPDRGDSYFLKSDSIESSPRLNDNQPNENTTTTSPITSMMTNATTTTSPTNHTTTPKYLPSLNVDKNQTLKPLPTTLFLPDEEDQSMKSEKNKVSINSFKEAVVKERKGNEGDNKRSGHHRRQISSGSSGVENDDVNDADGGRIASEKIASENSSKKSRNRRKSSLAQKDPRLLALVARSLRDAAGGAYDRALHRRNRARRLEAAERRRRAMQNVGMKGLVKNKENSKSQEKLGSSADGSGAQPPSEVDLHAPNEPRFLFNARASARTFCGVDLVPERVPLVPNGIHPRRRHGGGTGETVGFISVTPDDRIDEPLDKAIDAAQVFLDYILVLSSKEKIGEASATNLAREVQSLLRKIALQFEASYLVDSGVDFKSDLDIGPAIDSALTLILMWVRRSPHITNHHHHSAPPSTTPAPAAAAGTKSLSPAKKGKLGVGATGGEDQLTSPSMQPHEERQLRYCAISFALATHRASEALQKTRSATIRGF